MIKERSVKCISAQQWMSEISNKFFGSINVLFNSYETAIMVRCTLSAIYTQHQVMYMCVCYAFTQVVNDQSFVGIGVQLAF